MDITNLLDAVQVVGFPVVMCGALFWYMLRQDESNVKQIDSLRKTIDNNTKILTKLYERMVAND